MRYENTSPEYLWAMNNWSELNDGQFCVCNQRHLVEMHTVLDNSGKRWWVINTGDVPVGKDGYYNAHESTGSECLWDSYTANRQEVGFDNADEAHAYFVGYIAAHPIAV